MEHKEDLIQYRIQRAEQTLIEAQWAIEKNTFNLAENRRYYAIFYIVSALALEFGFSTSKHSTLRGWFNQMFLKPKPLNWILEEFIPLPLKNVRKQIMTIL